MELRVLGPTGSQVRGPQRGSGLSCAAAAGRGWPPARSRAPWTCPADFPRAGRQALPLTCCASVLRRSQLAGDLARGVVPEEPADCLGGGGKVPGVLPRLEHLGGRRECGDLAAGLG